MSTTSRPRFIPSTEVAKLVRKMLRGAFGSTTKFSVVTDKYSGGSTIVVSWTDGPSREEVQEVIGHLHSAVFDGMTDSTTYHLTEIEHPDGSRESVSLGNSYIRLERIGVEPGRECGWCDDPDPEHGHFAVQVFEDGRSIGRLGANGYVTTKHLHALVLSKAKAEKLADEINNKVGVSEDVLEREIAAEVRPF